jgi:chromosome segregation ATPase
VLKSAMKWYIVLSFLLAFTLWAQEQSLGDVARKNRNSAPQRTTKKVVTNEDLSGKSDSDIDSKTTPATNEKVSENGRQSSKYPLTAEQLEAAKNRVRQLKSRIADLESRRAEINQWKKDRKGEVAYCAAQKLAYGYSACEVVAEREAALQDVESRLSATKEQLAKLQERLRQMGYGSSVYDAT